MKLVLLVFITCYFYSNTYSQTIKEQLLSEIQGKWNLSETIIETSTYPIHERNQLRLERERQEIYF